MTGWIGIRIRCPHGATYLSADCCFSELALLKIQLSVLVSRTKRTSSSSRWNLTCSRHDIQTCSWKIAELALNNNHSLTHSKQWPRMSWVKLVLIYKTPYVSNNLLFDILMSEMHSIIQIHNFSEMVLIILSKWLDSHRKTKK